MPGRRRLKNQSDVRRCSAHFINLAMDKKMDWSDVTKAIYALSGHSRFIEAEQFEVRLLRLEEQMIEGVELKAVSRVRITA